MDPFGGSFRIGRMFDIEIRVHFLFVIFVVFRLLQAGDSMWFAAIFLSLLFGTVLLHEFGHCFGARSVGGYADNILMWPLGGLAYCDAPQRPWPQFVTVAAGPAVNVAFCLLTGGYIFFYFENPIPILFHNPLTGFPEVTSLGGDFDFVILLVYEVNLLLLVFNMLPIFPMDGGRLFQIMLWPIVGFRQAAETAAWAGLAGSAVFAYLWLTGQEGMFLLFIAIFGGFASWQQLQAVRSGMLFEDNPRFNVIKPRKKRRWFGARRRDERPASEPSPTFESPDPHEQSYTERLNAEVDRILRKVSDQGLASLTYAEKQTLERARRARRGD